MNGTKDFECEPFPKKQQHIAGMYYFGPLKILSLRKCRIIFAVSRKDCKERKWIIFKEFSLYVSPGPPTYFNLPSQCLKLFLGQKTEDYIPLDLRDVLNKPFHKDNQIQFSVCFVSEQFSAHANIAYNEDISKYCFFCLKVEPKKLKVIPFSGISCEFEVKLTFIDQKRPSYLSSNIKLLIKPGIPAELRLCSEFPEKIENNSNISDVSIGIFDKYGNQTRYKKNFDYILFDIEDEKLVDGWSQIFLSLIKDSEKYRLLNCKISISSPKFDKINNKEIALPCSFFAINDSDGKTNVVDSIKGINKIILITPCPKPQNMILTADTNGECSASHDFYCEVGENNCLYIQFSDEVGQFTNVRSEDILKSQVKIFGNCYDNNFEKDGEGNLYFEIKMPNKIEGNQDCFAECILKSDPNHKMRYDFVVHPQYSDPDR